MPEPSDLLERNRVWADRVRADDAAYFVRRARQPQSFCQSERRLVHPQQYTFDLVGTFTSGDVGVSRKT